MMINRRIKSSFRTLSKPKNIILEIYFYQSTWLIYPEKDKYENKDFYNANRRLVKCVYAGIPLPCPWKSLYILSINPEDEYSKRPLRSQFLQNTISQLSSICQSCLLLFSFSRICQPCILVHFLSRSKVDLELRTFNFNALCTSNYKRVSVGIISKCNNKIIHNFCDARVSCVWKLLFSIFCQHER
jgi:hypothetical protein